MRFLSPSAAISLSKVAGSSLSEDIVRLRVPLRPHLMTDHDAAFDAILEKLDAAGMVETYTDEDGQDELLAALLEDAEG
jgi:hypothetical protein